MQPMNYTIQTGGAGDAFQQGMERTAGLMTTAAEYQKAQQIATAQQLANEQAMQKRSDFEYASNNPTFENVQKLMIQYPELSEQFKRSLDSMDVRRKESVLSGAFSAVTALENGKPEIAIQLLDDNIEAAKNANDKDSLFRFESMRNLIIAKPNAAIFGLHGTLFGGMGGEKYAEAKKKLGDNQRADELQPSTVAKNEAEAKKAGVDAQYAGEKARTDIENTRSTIEDRKFDQRIKVMEAQLKREDNSLKREELQIKIDEAKAKREESSRMKTAEADTAMSSIATTKGLLNDILGDEDTLRSATGVGAWRGAIPGTESRSMAGKIEQLQNALAAENLDRLKGAMSDKDIQFIKNISANLDRFQDEDKLVSELKRVQQVLNDAEARAAKKYGRDGEQSKAAPVANDALSRLMQKYGAK